MNKLFVVSSLAIASIASVYAQPVAKKYAVSAVPYFCDPARPNDGSKCGTNTYAYDINNDGVVVGVGQGPIVVDTDDIDGDDNTTEEIRLFSNHGFRWQGDALIDLGHLQKGESYGLAINENGLVVGRSNLVTSEDEDENEVIQFRGFISDSNNVMSVIADPAQAIRLASAIGVANDGHVVGYAEAQAVSGDTGFYLRGFIKTPDSESPILIPGLEEKSASVLRAVNSTANIAVGYSVKSGAQRSIAVALDAVDVLIELPNLGGSISAANAVNDEGVVVGQSQVSGNTATEGFIYSSAQSPNIRSIGLLGSALPFSAANDINNDGLVVGTALAGLQPARYRAVAFDSSDSEAVLIDLNQRIDCAKNLDERWTLVEAIAVNDAGQIVGIGSQGTVAKSFVLTPLGDDAADPVACDAIDVDFEDRSGGGVATLVFGVVAAILARRRMLRHYK